VKWDDQLRELSPKLLIDADGFPKEPIPALSPGWFTARRGRITASKRAHEIADGHDFEWDRLKRELQEELQLSYVGNPFSNEATRWGQDHEAEAIANIELDTGLTLWEPGLVFHNELHYAGATPDAFANDHITVQIKCPFNPKYHLETVHSQRVPTKYFHQVQFESFISRRERILFCSYDPRQPMSTRTAMVWMNADPLLHERFDKRLREFYDFFHRDVVVAKPIGVDGIPNIFHRRKA
jgi:hypothetical protein